MSSSSPMTLPSKIQNFTTAVIPGRLYLTSTDRAPGCTDYGTDQKFFFSTDVTHAYVPFCQDFGPVNISVVHDYCQMLECILSVPEHQGKEIHHCFSTQSPVHAANAAVLIGAYAMLSLNMAPQGIKIILAKLSPTLPSFRDAGVGPSTWNLKVTDALKGIKQAQLNGFYDAQYFCSDTYKFYEQVENGDLNWIVPDGLLAFSGPHTLPNGQSNGYSVKTPADYKDYFKAYNVTDVVRLNRSEYSPAMFESQGIKHHDMYFVDGTTPSMDIVDRFLNIMDRAEGVVAVHCKAGLGRTGTLTAMWLMAEYDLSAKEAIAWVRLCRPGSIMGPQQHFVVEHQELMRKRSTRQLKNRRSVDHGTNSENVCVHKFGGGQ